MTALHFAAASDHAPIAKDLIAAGAEVDAVDAMRMTPLHHAAGWGAMEASKVLLEGGANLTKKAKGGNTPLDEARENGHKQVCRLLQAAMPRNP